MNNELLFNLCLQHLSIDVVYRLYPFSSILRRMVDNRFYWLKLIERDLKIVPKYLKLLSENKQELEGKLYYLRVMDYPIGTTLTIGKPYHDNMGWITVEKIDPPLQHIHYDVIKAAADTIVYRNGMIEILIHNKKYSSKLLINGYPPRIKYVRKLFDEYYIITVSGRVYRGKPQVDRSLIFEEMVILGTEVSDIGSIENDLDDYTQSYNEQYILTITHSGKMGQFLVVGKEIFQCAHPNIDARIVQISEDLLMDEDGCLYQINIPYNIDTINAHKLSTIISTFLPSHYGMKETFLALLSNGLLYQFHDALFYDPPQPNKILIDTIYNTPPVMLEKWIESLTESKSIIEVFFFGPGNSISDRRLSF